MTSSYGDYFSEEIDDSQNAVSTLLENFELPDIGNVKDTKFALKMGKYTARWCKSTAKCTLCFVHAHILHSNVIFRRQS